MSTDGLSDIAEAARQRLEAKRTAREGELSSPGGGL
jgi:hypothetical protein